MQANTHLMRPSALISADADAALHLGNQLEPGHRRGVEGGIRLAEQHKALVQGVL